MAVNRRYFNDFFSKDNIPEWLCPICSHGHLRLPSDKSIRVDETEASKKNSAEDYWDLDKFEGKFIAILKCSNKECSEFTYSTGNVIDSFEPNDEGQTELIRFVEPRFFYPTIKLFELIKDYPDEIKNKLLDAFKLFWVDKESCANKIRVVIELIMNDRSIKKTDTNKKGKRRNLTLHERIVIFGSKFNKLSSKMLAVKWIGNVGSHNNAGLKSSDLIDGFDLLESCLVELYSQEQKRLENLSNRITKSKGPLSKKKRKKKINFSTKGITPT